MLPKLCLFFYISVDSFCSRTFNTQWLCLLLFLTYCDMLAGNSKERIPEYRTLTPYLQVFNYAFVFRCFSLLFADPPKAAKRPQLISICQRVSPPLELYLFPIVLSVSLASFLFPAVNDENMLLPTLCVSKLKTEFSCGFCSRCTRCPTPRPR